MNRVPGTKNKQNSKKSQHQTKGSEFVLVDNLQCQKLAESIKRFEFSFDKFDDPLLYPNAEVEPSRVALFFFFIVAIDHRTHPKGTTFKGRVNGKELTGAELMYALAMKRFNEDATFFTAERMSRISSDEIAELFRATDPEIVDIAGPEERATILRNCGTELLQSFDGSVLNLIAKSNGFLVHGGSGFLELLKRFIAYQDPISKKSFLLSKFLERRHLIKIKDPENLHAPVDNILQRLALRTGIVVLANQVLENKIRSGEPVDLVEEETIRHTTMSAFDEVAQGNSLNAAYLDDLLWEFGRVHCQVPIPICDDLPSIEKQRPYRIIKSGPIGECPFGPGCRSYCNADRWNLKEPNFKTIFY